MVERRRDVFEEKIQVANNRGNLALLLLTSREWFSNCKTAVWRKWGLQRETLLHHFSFKGVLVLEVASTSKRKPQWHISNHQPGSSSLLSIDEWFVVFLRLFVRRVCLIHSKIQLKLWNVLGVNHTRIWEHESISLIGQDFNKKRTQNHLKDF